MKSELTKWVIQVLDKRSTAGRGAGIIWELGCVWGKWTFNISVYLRIYFVSPKMKYMIPTVNFTSLKLLIFAKLHKRLRQVISCELRV